MCVTVNEVSSYLCKILTPIMVRTYLQTEETLPHRSTPSARNASVNSKYQHPARAIPGVLHSTVAPGPGFILDDLPRGPGFCISIKLRLVQ